MTRPSLFVSAGSGTRVWDIDGKCYFDFLSAYSAVRKPETCGEERERERKQRKKRTTSQRRNHQDFEEVFFPVCYFVRFNFCSCHMDVSGNTHKFSQQEGQEWKEQASVWKGPLLS